MSNITTREAKISDLDSIAKIYANYWVGEDGLVQQSEVEYGVKLVDNAINKVGDGVKFNEHFIVAEDESGEVVGILGYKKLFHEFSHFSTTPRPIDMHDLFVAKSKFKAGIGQRLVDAFIEICKKENHSEIVIRSADRWKSSWGFYDKLEFERVGTIPEVNDRFSQVWHKILK